ncbi:MAG: GNAT family N-acetyltransferase [Thermoplasmata archaeon]|nr:GNAT family N-acetyltransferase [Thermoplasmata archaeon]
MVPRRSGDRRRSDGRSYRIRRGRLSDLPRLVEDAHRMWEAIGERSANSIAENDANYSRWLTRQMRTGRVAAFVAVSPIAGRIGSGCVWLRETHPRPGLPALIEPYILSVFTLPEMRGRGVASAIVRACLRWARVKGGLRASLHASVAGRSAYARIGFERTWEMRIWLDPGRRRRIERAARRRRPPKHIRRGLRAGRPLAPP